MFIKMLNNVLNLYVEKAGFRSQRIQYFNDRRGLFDSWKKEPFLSKSHHSHRKSESHSG